MYRKITPADSSIECLYSWHVLFVTLLIGSLSFSAIISIPVLLKPLASDWHADARDLALVHGLAMVGSGIGGVVLGRIFDRIGFFRISLIGAIATGAGLFLASRASTIGQLELAYGILVGGLAQGAFFGPLVAAVSLWFDKNRQLAMSVAACSQGVGGLIAPLLLRLGAQAYGWRGTLACFAIIAGTLIAIASLVFRRAPPTRAPERELTVARGRDNPSPPWRFVGYCSGIALFNFATFLVLGHLAAYGEERGFTTVHAALLMPMLLGSTLPFRLGLSLLNKWCGTDRMLAISGFALISGLCMLLTSTTYIGIGISVMVIGVGFGVYIPGFAVAVREMFPPSAAGQRIGEVYFWGFIASGLGSWLGGVLRDVSGDYTLNFFCAAGMASIGLVVQMRICLFRR
jgi:MFS family permease